MSKYRYIVVRNAEEQYSVWFAHREIPTGWEDVGFVGSRSECLDRIGELWQDLRPASLRRALGEA
jgi:MbtH protein